MNKPIDFESLNQAALSRFPDILPGGRVIGDEYCCAGITGGQGKNGGSGSFRLNLKTGAWIDNATGESGGDTISLIAAREGVNQGKAAIMLAELIGYDLGSGNSGGNPQKKKKAPSQSGSGGSKKTTTADAIALWNRSRPIGDRDHPYLQKKKIAVAGLRVAPDGALLVPAQDASGNFQAVTRVYMDDRGKRWIGSPQGAFFLFAAKDKSKGGPLILAEGIATGASLNSATGYATLTAFSATNLLKVATMARGLYPERKIIIAADAGDAGEQFGDKAAMTIQAYYAQCPAIEGVHGTDFNDLANIQGDEAVRQIIDEALAGEVMTGEDCEEEDPQGLSFLPTPPKVPLEAFPAEIASMLEEAAEGYQSHANISAGSFLAFLSCLIGNSRGVIVNESWTEYLNLYQLIVAASSHGKSPTMGAFMEPIEKLQKAASDQYEKDYRRYLQSLEDWKRDRLQARKENRECSAFDIGEEPEEPKRKVAYIQDMTLESCAQELDANPKGVLVWSDEFYRLIANGDRYNSSLDALKSFYLEAWGSGGWVITRATKPEKNIMLTEATVSLFGGIQTRRLKKLFQGGSEGDDRYSGLMGRFLFIFADRDKPRRLSRRPFTQKSKNLLSNMARIAWEWSAEDRALYSLSPEAYSLFEKWHDAIGEEAFISENGDLLTKLISYAIRIAGILAALDEILSFLRNDEGAKFMGIIDADCMSRALRLTEWLRANDELAWKLFADEKVKISDPLQRAIIEVIFQKAEEIKANEWRIKNPNLCPEVRKRLEIEVSNRRIGIACSKLKLVSIPYGHDRGWRIPKEFFYIYRTVGNVGNVAKHGLTTICEKNETSVKTSVNVGQTSDSSEKEIESDVKSDVSDVCDNVNVGHKTVDNSLSPTFPTFPTVIPNENFNNSMTDSTPALSSGFATGDPSPQSEPEEGKPKKSAKKKRERKML